MNKALLKKVKAASSISDLEALGLGNVVVDIGYRGGGLGFNGLSLAASLNISAEYLPRNFGAFSNYLGGGVRGAIAASGYSEEVGGKAAEFLDELSKAAVRAYEDAENESGLNDEEDEDGETNWDAAATKAARNAGQVSAY